MSNWKPITELPDPPAIDEESPKIIRAVVWVDDTTLGIQGWYAGHCFVFADGHARFAADHITGYPNVTHYMLIEAPGATE